MIPSRGWRPTAQNIGIGRRRIELLSRRSFSSSLTLHNPSKPSLLGLRAETLHRITAVRPQILRPFYAVQYSPAIRFQSTSTGISTSKDTIATTTDTPIWAQSSADLAPIENAINLDVLNIEEIPVQIGYLKALGLNYGYGPTSMMEWVLEHIHILAGTPWWGSIVLTAAFVRVVLLYPNLMGTDNAAKMATVAPVTGVIMDKMKEAGRAGDTAETIKLRTELSAINKKAGVQYWKTVLPLVQAPIGFGMFMILRHMINLPVPGFDAGGTLWFSNLTVPDPFYIIPIATASILHVLIKKGGETGVNGMSPEFMRGMSYFLPVLTLIFTVWLPSAIQLSFFTTGALSYLQAQLFRWGRFRNYMNMTPLPPPRPPPTPSVDDGDYTGPTPSQYQPRIITVRPNPQNVSGIYQPPRSRTTAGEKPTLLSGLKKEVSMGISSVQDTARKTMKSARQIAGQESKDGKRTKKQLQKANEYEQKRRAEEAKKREEARLARNRKRAGQYYS